MFSNNLAKKITAFICLFITCFIISNPLFTISNYLPVIAEEGQGNNSKNADIDELQVTFLNVAMGDCTFIKYGDTEVLVDSGEYTSNDGALNANGVVEYISNNVLDGELDYVIVSHGDSDHLGNMEKILQSLTLEKNIKILNIIDFDSLYYQAFYFARYRHELYDKYKDFFETKVSEITDSEKVIQDELLENQGDDKISKYTKERDKLRKKGTKYYCVAERIEDKLPKPIIIYEKGNKDSKYNTFSLGEGSNAPKMQILYNENYFDLLGQEEMGKKIQGKDNSKYAWYVNTKSVCTLITYGDSKVLLTGDLEESHNMKGESNLIKNYQMDDGNLLENVTLYKAAHHGSLTSNSYDFIKVIKPKYVAISAVANSEDKVPSRWGFPKQDVLDNLLSSTENIYITAVLNDIKQIKDYHGNITFNIDDKENVTVNCSNKSKELYDGDDKLLPLVDTKWFRENRTENSSVHVFSGFVSESQVLMGSCTLIKYGHREILINCGGDATNKSGELTSPYYINKVKEYCLDGVLECVIVTSPLPISTSYMSDIVNDDTVVHKGIFNSFKIEKLIDYGDGYDPSDNSNKSYYKEYNILKNELKKNKDAQYFSAIDAVKNGKIEITKNFSVTVLKNEYYGNTGKDRFESEVCSLVEFCGEKMLFTGNVQHKGEKSLVDNNVTALRDVNFYLASNFGRAESNSVLLLEKLSNSNKNLYIVINSVGGLNGMLDNRYVCNRFIKAAEKTYVTLQKNAKGNIEKLCGDITYTTIVKDGIKERNSLTGSKSTSLLSRSSFYNTLK